MRDLSSWFSRHPMAADGVYALALSPVVIGGTVSLNRTVTDGPYLLWGLAYLLPIVWRRTRPDLAALALVVPHLIQLAVVDEPSLANITVPIIVYAVAAYARPRWASVWLAVAVVAAAAAAWRWSALPPDVGATRPLDRALMALVNWGFMMAVVLVAWFMGQFARERRLAVLAVHQRADALEREQARTMELAASRERARIARDMHDIVAHSLSVIVVQCDGAGYVLAGSADPETKLATSKTAVDAIGQTARTALADTRRLVGVLKDAEAPQRTPAAGLSDIPALVERIRASGVAVELSTTGEPGAHPALGATAELTVYRILQEALTNVIKHAGDGAKATVALQHDAAGLHVHVHDDGQGPGHFDGLGHDDGLGNGLIGMRERATACGGTLIARPRFDKGFEVIATIPARQET